MHSLEASHATTEVRAVALGFVEVVATGNLIRHELSCDTELSGAALQQHHHNDDAPADN
jgi:hypothetical protein